MSNLRPLPQPLFPGNVPLSATTSIGTSTVLVVRTGGQGPGDLSTHTGPGPRVLRLGGPCGRGVAGPIGAGRRRGLGPPDLGVGGVVGRRTVVQVP